MEISAPASFHACPLAASRKTTRTFFFCVSSVSATTLPVFPEAPSTTNIGEPPWLYATPVARRRRDLRHHVSNGRGLAGPDRRHPDSCRDEHPGPKGNHEECKGGRAPRRPERDCPVDGQRTHGDNQRHEMDRPSRRHRPTLRATGGQRQAHKGGEHPESEEKQQHAGRVAATHVKHQGERARGPSHHGHERYRSEETNEANLGPGVSERRDHLQPSTLLSPTTSCRPALSSQHSRQRD